MSPWFSSARPRDASSGPSAFSVIPASTVTSSPSTDSSRFIRDRSSSAPSVQTMSVNECPAPATRTFSPRSAARRTAPETSSSDPGRSIATGAQRWSPAQLLHNGIA